MASTRWSLSLFAAGLALVSLPFSPKIARAEELRIEPGEDSEPEEDELVRAEKRDEADRTHLAGREEGALATPVKLVKEERAEKLCRDLQGETNMKPEANLEEVRRAREHAFRNVYVVLV